MTYNTQIGRFCDMNSNYEQLLCEKPYCVKTKHYYINDKHYVMFTYNQVNSDFNNDIVRECRGIIFREGEWTKPVCHAFDKFGNYQESYVPKIDWNSAKVTEKVDGSLIKVWYNSDTDDYMISTNGTINAFDAPIDDYRYKSFGELFVNAIDLCDLMSVMSKYNKSTYIFELVSPVNRVVVPYETIRVYFLGERDIEGNLTSFTDSECTEGFIDIGVLTPKVFNLSTFDEVVTAANELPWDEEGYVVHDKYNNRVKIKSPAYVIAHYSRINGNISEKHLIRVILEGQEEEFLTYCSDYKDTLLKTKQKMEDYLVKCKFLYTTIPNFNNRKDYATYVNKVAKVYRTYLFKCFDKYIDPQEFTQNWDENKWERMMNLK